VGKACRCHAIDGEVFWVSYDPSRTCKDYEAWERERGRKVWCFEEEY
jgi:hypothetical protein